MVEQKYDRRLSEVANTVQLLGKRLDEYERAAAFMARLLFWGLVIGFAAILYFKH